MAGCVNVECQQIVSDVMVGIVCCKCWLNDVCTLDGCFAM